MVAIYMLRPDDTALLGLWIATGIVLAVAALIRGVGLLHTWYVRRQIARIEREGLAALDWHAQHSHGGWR